MAFKYDEPKCPFESNSVEANLWNNLQTKRNSVRGYHSEAETAMKRATEAEVDIERYVVALDKLTR